MTDLRAWRSRLRGVLAAAGPRRAPRVAVRYLGGDFTVTCHRDGLAAELPCFVLPHAHGPAAPGGWMIHVLGDDDLAGLEVGGPDTGDGELAVRTESSGVWTVTDWRARVRWHVAAPHTRPRRLVQDVYCGIRRIGLACLPSAALLHAAAVRVRGRTVVFLGHKGSGKSCHAHHLVVSERADLVAGDKLCVWSDGGEAVRAAGLIESIRLELDGAAPRAEPAHPLWRAVREAAADPACVVGRKACLSPRRFADAAGVEVVASTRPDALVVLAPASRPQPLVRLDAATARSALHAHLIEDGRADGTRALGPTGEVTLAALAGSCPMYVLRGRHDLTTLSDTLRRALD